MTEEPDTPTESTDVSSARLHTASARPSDPWPATRIRTDGGHVDEPAEAEAEEAATDDDTEDGSRDLSTSLEWAGLLVLGLLAVIATFRFYLAASTAIGRLVTPEYEPLFQAGFNLVILLLAVTGISLLTRRLVLDR